MEPHIYDISHVIQLSVAPVFLLTAIATLINAMNSRLGRIVDRRRAIARGVTDTSPEEAEHELHTLLRRSHLIYLGILFAVLSALLICLVIASAFVGALIATDLTKAVAVVFILSLSSMIGALGMFLREVSLGIGTVMRTLPSGDKR